MPTFGFSAFLKLLSLNPKPQRREVRTRLSPSTGGYDFHRSLRLKVRRLMLENEDIETLLEEASHLGNPAERRSLEEGLRLLDDWRRSNPGEVTDIASALYVSPHENFKVSFIPDFGYRMGDKNVAIHVWNTGTVQLSERMTYVALELIASSYDEHTAPDDLAVLSLPDRRLYRLDSVPDQGSLAALVAADLDRTFEGVRDGMTTPPPAPPEIRPTGTTG